MRAIKFIIYLLLSIKKNTSFVQFSIFTILILVLLLIGLFSLLKVIIPFTYVAL